MGGTCPAQGATCPALRKRHSRTRAHVQRNQCHTPTHLRPESTSWSCRPATTIWSNRQHRPGCRPEHTICGMRRKVLICHTCTHVSSRMNQSCIQGVGGGGRGGSHTCKEKPLQDGDNCWNGIGQRQLLGVADAKYIALSPWKRRDRKGDAQHVSYLVEHFLFRPTPPARHGWLK